MSQLFSVIERRNILTASIFDVERLTVALTLPDRPVEQFTRDVVRNSRAVSIVAIDADHRVALTRQFRAALDAEIFELPAGRCDQEEEAALATARRELLEEVGCQAATWLGLGGSYLSPGFSDEWHETFLAQGLTHHGSAPDGPEELAMSIHWVPMSDALADVRSGAIHDAKTKLGLLLAATHLSALEG